MRASHWRAAPDRRDEARLLSREFDLNPVVTHLLLNRGLSRDQFAEYLRPTMASEVDYNLLPDIEPAAERLVQAIGEQQPVCIYGDYDTDGSTGGAILYRFLTARGVPCEYYVPRREGEGYGLNAQAVVQIITKFRPKLLITVDCGITSAEEVDTAVALGVDVIVTDHHLPGERLPAAPAVNPQRTDKGAYPQPEIAGAAVAYKLCQKTAELLGENPFQLETVLLELVAVGTVADMMPLIGENRYFVYRGLELLRHTQSLGLRALMETAGVGDGKILTSRDIGFMIGPRLNAAGRLEDARAAFELLVTDDNARAWQLADELEKLNRERQNIEGEVREQASERIKHLSLFERWGLVLAGEGWHEGVVGLVAGRLAQRYHRPVLVLSIQGDVAKGSGRSNKVVDLHGALTDCADLLTGFGGHHQAAGLSIAADMIDELADRFNAAVRARMTEEDMIPVHEYDCSVRASAATMPLAKALEWLEPTGQGNPPAKLRFTDLQLEQIRLTRDGAHMQLSFDTGRGAIRGFWPGSGREYDRFEPGQWVEAVGTVTIDTWQGNERLQLLIEDLRHAPA